MWRTKRTHAAAKVDALANNGMDEIEIPAYLRKQADRAGTPVIEEGRCGALFY